MTISNLQIVTTEDGSKTIFNPLVGENYHSIHGALQESKHVFLNAGLQHFLEKTSAKEVSVLEVGFGTGLNFLLTAKLCSEQQIPLNYVGLEAFPLSINLLEQINYSEILGLNTWLSFKNSYPNALIDNTAYNQFCNYHVAPTPLEKYQSNLKYDIIYFDAFGSANQPEMWTTEAITHTMSFLKEGGYFVTYAITGNLKRLVKSLGMTFEKIPGAPGKREMLRAYKPFL